MPDRKFAAKTWVPIPIETAFEFFSKAENLDRITPPWLHFKILTPLPVEMGSGTLLDYRLKLHGIPIKWQTQIVEWNPPFRFVDLQLRGPYRKWVHTHTFAEKDNGTVIEDNVVYAVPGFILEPLINKYFVEPDIIRVFDYRQKQLKEIFQGTS
jgi:ligand-binding SRPBCC domain-containing protein